MQSHRASPARRSRSSACSRSFYAFALRGHARRGSRAVLVTQAGRGALPVRVRALPRRARRPRSAPRSARAAPDAALGASAWLAARVRSGSPGSGSARRRRSLAVFAVWVLVRTLRRARWPGRRRALACCSPASFHVFVELERASAAAADGPAPAAMLARSACTRSRWSRVAARTRSPDSGPGSRAGSASRGLLAAPRRLRRARAASRSRRRGRRSALGWWTWRWWHNAAGSDMSGFTLAARAGRRRGDRVPGASRCCAATRRRGASPSTRRRCSAALLLLSFAPAARDAAAARARAPRRALGCLRAARGVARAPRAAGCWRRCC